MFVPKSVNQLVHPSDVIVSEATPSWKTVFHADPKKEALKRVAGDHNSNVIG